VIELSIDDTNALRAKLGLKPLRGVNGGGSATSAAAARASSNGAGEELSLSVSESNDLRSRLGLPPLRVSDATTESGRKASEAVHAPATNAGEDRAARTRVEDARARRDVEAGIGRLAATAAGLGDDDDADAGVDGGDGAGAAGWAAKMRAGKGKKATDAAANGEADGDGAAKDKKKKKKKKSKKKGKKSSLRGTNRISVPNDDDEDDDNDGRGGDYSANDLAGMAVGHSVDDFEAGQTTVLTLADTSLLDDGGGDKGSSNGGGGGGPVLENANMRDDSVTRDNLRKKRMVEMGMGHAGGYAGYDDDEFVELGGSQAAARRNKASTAGSTKGGDGEDGSSKSGSVGFRIGDGATDATGKGGGGGGGGGSGGDGSDLFAGSSGRAVSLQTGTLQSASDFMTHDEAEADDEAAVRERGKREKEARKREKKLFKKMKKDKKKKRDRKEHRRRDDHDDDDDHDNAGDDDYENAVGTASKGGILDDLEATAHTTARDGRAKNRGSRRRREREGENKAEAMDVDGTDADDAAAEHEEEEEEDVLRKKRRKFDEVMEKGNKRTADAFGLSARDQGGEGRGAVKDADEDDGEDDAFLHAALAKARRLRRLKELQTTQGSGVDTSSIASADFGRAGKGAEAVMQAVRSAKAESKTDQAVAKASETGGVSFEFDETREFTRALRARAEQADRGVATTAGRATGGVKIGQTGAAGVDNKTRRVAATRSADATGVEEDDIEDQPVSIEELAEQMSDDGGVDDEGGFGSSAASAPVGRGLANVLSMLKQTGEITGKNAGKEELRGRAKDERTYDDYETLDLKEVVKIEQSAMTNAKDREFANREIKLEYRDEHGRLLTRKEAYRQMCYQFHGHGSSKKNEERRLKQISRERAEAAAASRLQGGKGTLGALKATQEATGKAFVVHKTG